MPHHGALYRSQIARMFRQCGKGKALFFEDSRFVGLQIQRNVCVILYLFHSLLCCNAGPTLSSRGLVTLIEVHSPLQLSQLSTRPLK